MVGNEKGYGHQCRFVPGIHCGSACWGFISERVSVSECRYLTLEGQSLSYDGNTQDQVAAKAAAQAGFYDALRGGPFSVEGAANISPSEVFHHRMVHGEPPQRDNGPEVVDGES